MNKEQAINWCVENINTWPSFDKGVVSTPKRWSWVDSKDPDTGFSNMVLVNKPCNELINKCDWISALIEPHSDGESVF